MATAGVSTINLKWEVIGKSPRELQRWANTVVVLGSTVYFNDLSVEPSGINVFDYESGHWSEIPIPPNGGTYALVLVNDLLTAVGGRTNKLFSRTSTDKGTAEEWTEKFPPMPTARHGVTAVCTKTALIVAGGDDSKIVEVMNTETLQWSTAANLPTPLAGMSAAVCGDCLYMMGGHEQTWLEGMLPTNSVYTCSLSALLEPTPQRSLGARLASALSLSRKPKIWKRVADLPVTESTCVFLNGQLLAIGGAAANAATVAVRKYNPTADKWNIISHMSQPRHSCFAAVLPNNTLLVIGGRGPEHYLGYIIEVEKATME